MRTPNGIYFAPTIRFRDLNLYDAECLAEALDSRAEEWFLRPAESICEASAFASGVLLTCFVDGAAGIADGNFIEWLKRAVPDSAAIDPRRTTRTVADSVYEDVRNGLVHHARLNRGAEFSKDTERPFEIVHDVLIVNPRELSVAVRRQWKQFLATLRNDEAVFKMVVSQMKRTFRVDFEADARFP